MAEIAAQQPLGIQDLLKNTPKINSNSAQEALAARYLRSVQQQKGQKQQLYTQKQAKSAQSISHKLLSVQNKQLRYTTVENVDNSSAFTQLHNNQAQATEQTMSGQLRKNVMQTKQHSVITKGFMKEVDSAGKQATGKLLAAAWLNLLDSFGLTLIYINIHVFLRWVLGDRLFCKLGEEWLPTQARAGVGHKIGQGAGLIEVIILIMLDCLIGALIIGALALIIMIITWMSEFDEAGVLKKGWIIVKAIWNLGFENLQALINLF